MLQACYLQDGESEIHVDGWNPKQPPDMYETL